MAGHGSWHSGHSGPADALAGLEWLARARRLPGLMSSHVPRIAGVCVGMRKVTDLLKARASIHQANQEGLQAAAPVLAMPARINRLAP